MGAKSNVLTQKLMPFVNKEGLSSTQRVIRYFSKKKLSEIKELKSDDIKTAFDFVKIGRI